MSPQPKKGMTIQYSGPTSNLRTLAGKLFFNQSSQLANFETQDTFKPSALQQSITQQLVQHHMIEQETKQQKLKDQMSTGIQGMKIDAFCFQKESNLQTLSDEIRALKREKDQLKKLNEKLVARLEEL